MVSSRSLSLFLFFFACVSHVLALPVVSLHPRTNKDPLKDLPARQPSPPPTLTPLSPPPRHFYRNRAASASSSQVGGGQGHGQPPARRTPSRSQTLPTLNQAAVNAANPRPPPAPPVRPPAPLRRQGSSNGLPAFVQGSSTRPARPPSNNIRPPPPRRANSLPNSLDTNGNFFVGPNAPPVPPLPAWAKAEVESSNGKKADTSGGKGPNKKP